MAKNRKKYGVKYWFDEHTMHFEALRAAEVAPFGGSEIGEVTTVISQIKNGSAGSWYDAFYRMAQIVDKKAQGYEDRVSKGYAYLRAHTYYRSAEFFLHGDDRRRTDTWERQVSVFDKGLEYLKVERHKLEVPYENVILRADYYPCKKDDGTRPLIVVCNGYDGTSEELYFTIVVPARERGYSVLIYEGPGQGAVIRKYGMVFTHEWEKPTRAVLDYFEKQFGKPNKMVLLGVSLGAILGMRAAAKIKRIDGFIAIDAWFDAGETSSQHSPAITKWLLKKGYRGVVNWIMRNSVMKKDMTVDWAVNHGRWVLGAKDESSVLTEFAPYHLRDVIQDVRCDVLLLAAENDHFFAASDQLGKTQRGLVNAKSVTVNVFKNGEGGEEHCHTGANHQTIAIIVEWVNRIFVKNGTTN